MVCVADVIVCVSISSNILSIYLSIGMWVVGGAVVKRCRDGNRQTAVVSTLAGNYSTVHC